MAKKLSIKNKDDVEKLLTKGFQSGNLSFLIGSGASSPAVPLAGPIERELNDLLKQDKKAEYESKLAGFLIAIQNSTNDALANPFIAPYANVLEAYQNFLVLLSEILEARRTKLLSKQATVFTTNYDVLIEMAAEELQMLRLNDGFQRIPSMRGEHYFRPETFFEVTHSTGNLFNYEFALPTINLVKLHGSLTWAGKDSAISYRNPHLIVPDSKKATYLKDLEAFTKSFSLIVPTFAKFERTLMERVYYDLLRLLANRLDLENSLIVAFGFSFEDEHILDIVNRALKNPTLLLLVFAHSQTAVASYLDKFKKHNNVVVIHPEDADKLGFTELNLLLSCVKPKTLT